MIDQATQVIIVAGTQKTQEAVEVLNVGVFAYVPKPCDFTQFEHLVALALPSGRPSMGDEAPVRPLRLLGKGSGVRYRKPQDNRRPQ